MTTNKHSDSSQLQGDSGDAAPPPQGQLPRSRDGNAVIKSGPLFISSKGIGWTSWKKRWFILTKTSLVFFRSDPNGVPQKGSEVNLTLGGIDLNNSGSVVVKADKKLLTVLFPDGRDGRTFTLKAETMEDLYDWKSALENALPQAPSATLMMGQNGIFRNDQDDGVNGSPKELNDKQRMKSSVIGRPILLALEEVDGSPSFLEKALKFIEEHGINVEGILRQAADVEDVERRIQEYEQGKTEFSADEDAHVIGDCIKYFLRELPSYPVPASCCNALVGACRADRGSRVNAMREAICETFPEPNRKLLQRILLMMQAVASNKAKNRMSTSAVAACMAPLLLRPLLAGECETETNIDVGGDGSIQLLKAAAAANHAQAIVITLLEEYDSIFREGSMSPGLYSDSDDYDSEDEDVSEDDDGKSYEDDEHDSETHESDVYTEDDYENACSGRGSGSGSGIASGSGDSGEDSVSDKKMQSSRDGSGSFSPKAVNSSNEEQKLFQRSLQTILPLNDDVQKSRVLAGLRSNSLPKDSSKSNELLDIPEESTSDNEKTDHNASPCSRKPTTIANGPEHTSRRRTVWGRTSAKKNLSMESIDYPVGEEVEIQKLEASKLELLHKISEEAKRNAVLQAKLEERRKALHYHRLALEHDVVRLQEQLQKEREKREVLEAELNMSKRPPNVTACADDKIKADLDEIRKAEADVNDLQQRVDDLSKQLSTQHEQNYAFPNSSSDQALNVPSNISKGKNKQKDSESAAASRRLGRSSSKLWQSSKVEGAERDKKCSIQGLQLDIPPRMSSSKAIPSPNSKRSTTKTEGSNSAASALTKLTSRLNFLKERRTQITNELQNIDKGQGSGLGSSQAVTSPDSSRGSESSQSFQNRDSIQSPKTPLCRNPVMDGELEASHASLDMDRLSGVQEKLNKDSDTSR